MSTDLIYHGGVRIYDRFEDCTTRLLSGSRTLGGVEFHTADWSKDQMRPEVFLSIEQTVTLRDWLTKRIEESSDV